MQKKLFLLDAFALIFRAYYALIRSPRITSKGKNTNAQFGFTNTLIELMNKEKPTHLAVCFDMEELTERHTDFADYKANRQETPEDLLAAIPDIKKIIEAFNIPVIGIPGYEADDVIGTLAWEAHDAGYEVFMVTPDKDYGQLVRDGITIYKPAYQGGNVELMGPKEVCEKWNIDSISQVVDMLGLMGDAVDNIPGIPGIGEKTAAKLLKEYGTLENVLANADNIKGVLGEKIRAGKESAIISKKLATIITNVPVSFHEENFRLKPFDKEKLIEVFTELEFKTLGKRVLGEDLPAFTTAPQAIQTDLFGTPVTPQNNYAVKPAAYTNPTLLAENFGMKDSSNTAHTYHLVNTPNAIQQLIETLLQQKEIAFDTETTGIDANQAQPVGMSFAFRAHDAYYVPVPKEKSAAAALLHQFSPLWSREDVLWIGQNIKYDLLVLKWQGIELKGKILDTMLAHYVIEPDGKHNMDGLSEQYLHYQPISIESLIGKKGKGQGNMQDVELEKIKEYAAEDADITLQLKQVLLPLVKEKQVQQVLDQIENPLVPVLTRMEYEGVAVDVDFLHAYSKTLATEAKAAEESVYQQAGVRFNLASPKQLGEVLFDKLQLDPSAKKTKTGQYQTGEDVLTKLAAKGHKIVEDILAFRELTKLNSTYVEALPALIHPITGRVHTSYAQAVAVTGRLSSNNPNLQNIPIRSDRGREIRKAFIPRKKNRFIVSADYSQIELRIVAAISGDANMCTAFKAGKDIHTATAAKVYGIDETAVTKEMRYKAKSVNFGIIYGQGAFGLADNLGISRTEAKEIIDNYKKEFPGITAYMENTIAFAQKHGYVETLMGRKRWLKDINSANFTVRGYAERNAINSPIQGTAADMIKLAMIKIDAALRKEKLRSVMILQVHDELVFDVVPEELEMIQPLILNNMREALVLPNKVPIEAEIGIGKNWLEAH
ncbi:MAG: DNA polymerase I [Sphingobacteriales bacterium]|uniref:DNA polymerase I n=1 Tax=Hydrotalea flava TaxID=714549 RepID=UPI000830F9D9|nr:DNA polymerase I [Hydrotalea flava]RTL47978.1 MAG: DNA polymerase I [Sphingobacteriales bacterium]